MKRISTLVLLCGAIFASASAYAGKWGMAGCGVGSMIFEDKPGKIQILASITNNYFVQSSSISSGTSNCTEMSAHEEAMLYINVNREPLARDISRGSGEALEGLAKVFQCSDSGTLNSALKKNFKQIFPTEQSDSMDVAKSIETTIKSDPVLKANCGNFT